MRCVKFCRTTQQTPILSNKCVGAPLPSMTTKTEPEADLRAGIRRSSVAPITVRSTATRSLRGLTRSQSLTVHPSQNATLIPPVSAASSETTPTTMPTEVRTTTKGQTTRSQKTQVCVPAIKVEVGVPSVDKPAVKLVVGGRHPHPPTGNNKKLKHKCPFDGCPWRFATPYKLRRHIKSHTKETPYLCKECGRGFSVRYNLLMHIQTIHSQPQRYKCPIRGCKEAFHSQPRLNGHLRRIHKKDVKTMQTKDSSDSGCNSRGSSTSSMDSNDSSTSPTNQISKSGPTKQRRKYECLECKKEFTSQAKLNVHCRTHSGEKPFKCSIQGCEKSFTSRDRLLKHSETHKNTRQFCCPHKNCNRVFLLQSHVKNHLKIHTQDHQFICPVLDCNKKFSIESDYNTHLNTHINYGHKCTHPGCNLSFLSKKRLLFHCRAVHNIGFDGAHSSFLDGIQPHLGIAHQSSHLISPLPHGSVFSYEQLPHQPYFGQPIKTEDSFHSCHGDFIAEVNLPGLSQKDIETVLSQNKNWSGEQIDQFLRSAVDLSEIESKFFSATGYESDSGYSTYDVSPITTAAPFQHSYPLHCQMNLQTEPVMGSVEHSAGPMFNCTFSPTSTVFPGGLTSTASSPCSSEVGLFSPGLDSVASTPNQDTSSFFPSQTPTPGMATYPHPAVTMFGNSYFLEDTSTTNSIPSFNSQIPDIMVSNAGNASNEGIRHHNGRRNSDSQLTLRTNLGKTSKLDLTGQLGTRSLPNVGRMSAMVTQQGFPMPIPSVSAHGHLPMSIHGQGQSLKVEDERRHSCHATANMYSEHLPISISQNTCSSVPFQSPNSHRFQSSPSNQIESETHLTNSRVSIMKATKKAKTSITKTGQRRKNQWPRSMNKANMMAFRQHILNKLKKGQESTLETCESTFVNCVKQEASSPRPVNSEAAYSNESSEEKCDLNGYEVQVTVQRNHSMSNRSKSEPIANSNPNVTNTAFLHSSQSANNINNDSSMDLSLCDNSTSHLSDLFLGDADCNDILSSLQFNPDSLLSGVDEDHMLKTLGFDEMDSSRVDEEIAKLLGVGSDSLISLASTNSGEVMDLDCIQELLDDDPVSSPLSLPTLTDCNSSPSVTISSLPPSPSFASLSPGSASLLQGQSSPSPVFSNCSSVQQTDCPPVTGYETNVFASTPQYTIPVESIVSTQVGANDACGNDNPLMLQATSMTVNSDVAMGVEHSSLHSVDPMVGGSGLFQTCSTEVFEI